MGEGLAALGLVWMLFVMALAILWILVPFAIFGIKPLLRELTHVVINGAPKAVGRVVVHPDYRAPPHDLIHQAMATGKAVLVLVLLASFDDIALIELSEEVSNVAPVAIYAANDEANRTFKILGKAQWTWGMRATTHDLHGPIRTELRRAFNTITSAHECWLC